MLRRRLQDSLRLAQHKAFLDGTETIISNTGLSYHSPRRTEEIHFKYPSGDGERTGLYIEVLVNSKRGNVVGDLPDIYCARTREPIKDDLFESVLSWLEDDAYSDRPDSGSARFDVPSSSEANSDESGPSETGRNETGRNETGRNETGAKGHTFEQPSFTLGSGDVSANHYNLVSDRHGNLVMPFTNSITDAYLKKAPGGEKTMLHLEGSLQGGLAGGVSIEAVVKHVDGMPYYSFEFTDSFVRDVSGFFTQGDSPSAIGKFEMRGNRMSFEFQTTIDGNTLFEHREEEEIERCQESGNYLYTISEFRLEKLLLLLLGYPAGPVGTDSDGELYQVFGTPSTGMKKLKMHT